MNKWTKKVTALALCAAMCISSTETVFAKETDENTAEGKVITKEETVYVITDAEGTENKIIVSDWLKNSLSSQTISDRSQLEDIENVNGDETFTEKGDQKIWEAKGQDIYYQGSTKKELPVEMKITYKLDGKIVSPEEIAGESGKAEICIDYVNRQYEMVDVNGKEEKIYVPFVALSGMILDSETFRNVEVSGGKILNDGTHMTVLGYAFPGLQEDLDPDQEKIEIPGRVVITADVTDFEIGSIVSVVSNEIFQKTDDTEQDKEEMQSLEETADEIGQLMEGNGSLYEEVSALLGKSGELLNGVSVLAEGVNTLKEGVDSLDTGASQLQMGSAELSAGLNTLSSNSASLNAGAEQVFNTLLATATSQVQAAGAQIPALTIENYAEVLNGVITSLGSSQGAQSISALKVSLDSYNTFYTGLLSYTGGVDSSAVGAAKLAAGASSVKSGTTQLKTGVGTLSAGLQTMKGKMPELTDGILTRFKAVSEAGKNYNNFSGIGEDMNGQVRFIYRTEAIRVE